MDNLSQFGFDLKDRSYISLIKKEIVRYAAAAGFDATKSAQVDLIVTEIGTNLIKHAGGGEIIVRLLTDYPSRGIELIAIDSGPGMTDTFKMMEDGVSTTQTLGHGLGTIRRLSDQCQIYSVPGWGTVLLSRIFAQPLPSSQIYRTKTFPIVVPKPGEEVCGDLFDWKVNHQYLKVLMADGLGHGFLAREAAVQAAQAFRRSLYNSPHQILGDIHTGVKRTRGLVATVGVFDFATKTWQFSGVGNISSRLCNALTSRTYVPFNGIVGVNVPRELQSQVVKYEEGRSLVMCSDGISSRWDLHKHHAAFRYDPSIMAAVIYKDFARHTDDMSVVVVKAA